VAAPKHSILESRWPHDFPPSRWRWAWVTVVAPLLGLSFQATWASAGVMFIMKLVMEMHRYAGPSVVLEGSSRLGGGGGGLLFLFLGVAQGPVHVPGRARH